MSLAQTLARGAVGGVGAVVGYVTATEMAALYNDAGPAASRTDQNITFPTDLLSVNEGRNAYCILRFSRYTRRSIREQPRLNVMSGVRLPLPANLREMQSVNYSTESLGPLIGATADAATSVINRGAGSFSSIESLGRTLQSTGSSIAAGAGAQAVIYGSSLVPGGFGKDILNGLSAVSGIAINPFQTVLFKAPNFKKHSFSWKLIPRNETESELIRRIVEIFKYHSSPGISESAGVFFSYPEILEIQLFPKEEYLYSFKPCVVESVTVNYAPNGPSIYKGSGAPAAVEITISIQEIEYWTKNDYFGSSPGGGGGGG